MKTTIDLPDELISRAKRYAASSGRSATLRSLVIAGLERELDARENPSAVELQWTTVGGAGLTVDPESAIATAYGLES